MSNNTLFISIFFLFFCFSLNAQQTYLKKYFSNGLIKSEGWIKNNQKVDYWRFYYENGTLESEGHFLKGLPTKFWKFYRNDGTKKSEGHYIYGLKNKWWVFYDEMEMINHKCQLKDSKKNGYCLRYENKKLVKAQKYKAGKKIKEWTDYSSFKKENKLSDLR